MDIPEGPWGISAKKISGGPNTKLVPYEGWDLSSSIKGLFYYQHVDCGYYCVACRCIVCGHCSSHQPTDQRRQDCRLQERSPCCRAAVSPGSCSLLLYIMRSLRSLEAEQHEYHIMSQPIPLTSHFHNLCSHYSHDKWHHSLCINCVYGMCTNCTIRWR